MSMVKKTAFILALSVVCGLGFNYSLIKKYCRGEFEHGFFHFKDYPSLVFISLGEAEELFLKGEALFIDSREKEAFREGHIPGARNIPFEAHGEESLPFPGLLLERTLVVYCDGSECQSSVELARTLHRQGFKDLRVFFGGWAEWLEAGLPAATENDWQ